MTPEERDKDSDPVCLNTESMREMKEPVGWQGGARVFNEALMANMPG